jgi:hypothetical protein
MLSGVWTGGTPGQTKSKHSYSLFKILFLTHPVTSITDLPPKNL